MQRDRTARTVFDSEVDDDGGGVLAIPDADVNSSVSTPNLALNRTVRESTKFGLANPHAGSFTFPMSRFDSSPPAGNGDDGDDGDDDDGGDDMPKRK